VFAFVLIFFFLSFKFFLKSSTELSPPPPIERGEPKWAAQKQHKRCPAFDKNTQKIQEEEEEDEEEEGKLKN